MIIKVLPPPPKKGDKIQHLLSITTFLPTGNRGKCSELRVKVHTNVVSNQLLKAFKMRNKTMPPVPSILHCTGDVARIVRQDTNIRIRKKKTPNEHKVKLSE